MLRIRNLLVLLVACFAFIAFQSNNRLANNGDDPTKDQVLIEVVLQYLKHNHVAPEAVDDKLSQRVFDMYVKRIDNNKRFFLKEDMDELLKYRSMLDDAALVGDFEFFNKVEKIRQLRYSRVADFYEELLAKPFDFSKEESLQTNGDKVEYVKTEAELKSRWRKHLKYQVLTRVQSKLEQQEKAITKKDTTVKIKTTKVLEKEARQRVLKSWREWTTNFKQEDRDDKMSIYINAIAGAHEPHTGYYPPLEKENFNIRMSGKLEGIGAQLRQEDGFIKVVRIVPGSASYRQGELEVNDKIIKVAQGKADPVDVVDMKMDDVLPMIRGKKGTEVRLTVRKKDGTSKTIPIVRDVVVLEESYAKSAIIEHKKTKNKVGFIDLRTFYADFHDPKGRRCAKDVRKEVQKLIAEDIDGIVIDLRFNGGGSLSDVVDMTGLFVERGPIVQVKGRGKEPLVLEDNDPSVLYDGPLVIMVNSFSASASEIMAAALQDYGRAVIVGTAPSTFGKGTVQRFYKLDDAVPPRLKGVGELGSIKITIQKFYRINGGSTQLKGVIPDIILPGVYSYIDVGEKEEEYPMEWTEIEAAKYKSGSSLSKLEKIKKKSAKRVSVNPSFAMIEENAKWLQERQEQSEYSLNLEKFSNEQKENDKKAAEFRNVSKEIADMHIRSLAADAATLEQDTVRRSSINNWHKNLRKDTYLEEVVHIINDLK